MGIIGDNDAYILNTYKRYPLVFIRGNGVYLFSDDGYRYLDMAAGIAVSSLGHFHPKVYQAIEYQAKRLIHTSNLYYTWPYTELAVKLINKSIFNKVFFCNSGAEANEAVIKLSRKHGKNTGGNDKYKIIVMKNSFHGRTMGTLSATGQPDKQKGFEPLLEGFKFIEFNNKKDLENNIDNNTAAVMLEVLQGEGGIHLADKGFIKDARKLCDKYNALLIYDEVQTGIGRTGKLFGYEHYLPVQPDAITLAKGLAGGMPIGAMLVKEKYADLLKPGEHASTFGGNAVCCACANAVLDAIDEERLLENAEKMGNYLFKNLNDIRRKYKTVKDVRGIGLIYGMELTFDANELINKLIDNFVLTVPAGKNVIRFTPPLIIQKDHIDELIIALNKVLKDF